MQIRAAHQVKAVNDVRRFLRDERRRRKLTQSQLADLTATSQKWISDFERGRVDPPISIVLKVLLLLGVSVGLSPAPLSTDNVSESGPEL